MFHNLDKFLRVLLSHELSPEKVMDISFDAPDNQFPPSGGTLPAINLFLYDIRENHELRNEERLTETGRDGLQPVPLYIDCSYLVTAWPREGSNNPAMEEHRMMGEVMQALLLHPTLLSGILQDNPQVGDPQLPATLLQPFRLNNIDEFWQAMGSRPRLALNYTVTLNVVLPRQEVQRANFLSKGY